MELQIEKLLEYYESQANDQSPREIETQIQYYEVAQAILDDPEQHPKVLHDRIRRKLGGHLLPFYTPRKILGRYSGLNTPGRRVAWVNLVNVTGSDLVQFVQENPKNGYKVLHDRIRKVVFAEKRIPQMQPKAILFVFCSALPSDVSYKSTLEKVIRVTNFGQSVSLLRGIIDLIAAERGLIQKRAARDQAVGSIISTLVHLQSVSENDISESDNDLTAEVEELRDEVEELRDTVEIAQQGLKSLLTDIDKIDDEARQETFTTFFQEMNSVKHSYFLDYFLRVEEQLKEMTQQVAELPNEIELISALVPIFNQFLNTHGVEPQESVGEQINLTLKESDHYEYIGSDFKNTDETKTVEVISSGWICEGKLIIKPRVKEVV